MLDTLYFVQFQDGGIYCPNALGPMGFQARPMAQELADTIDGTRVVERGQEDAIIWCKEKNAALFVTLANGKVLYSEDATPLKGAQPDTVRIEGEERERLIQVRNAQRQQ